MDKENPLLSPLLAEERYCYLTTTGRVTGKPHEIEIWFSYKDGTLYLLSRNIDRSDWVKNLLKNPSVTVRIGEQIFSATARLVEEKDEEIMARNLHADKYNERRINGSLAEWVRTALVIGIDVNAAIG